MRPSAEFIAHRKEPLRIAEIGVRTGENAILMLKGLNIERLYLVDPYLSYNDGAGFLDEPAQLRYYYNMFKNMMPYFDKCTFITKSSVFGSALFDDEYFDYIYIDGDHSYKEVSKDLKHWYPKLKVGGCFAGHDINWDGVNQAVNEFTEKINIKYQVRDIDWFFIKEKE